LIGVFLKNPTKSGKNTHLIMHILKNSRMS